MGSKKYNKLVNITTTTKKWTPRFREQTSGYQWGKRRVRGNTGIGDYEVQLLGME